MQFLKVAQVMKPRGLKGETRIYLTTDFPSRRFKVGNLLYLYNDVTKEHLPVTVASFAFDKDNVGLIRFKELSTIEQIEGWQGKELHAEKKTSDLPTGFIYHDDLIGSVVLFNDEQIGSVLSVEQYAPYVTLRIALANSKKTITVPFVDNFIISFNHENKVVILQNVEGLL